MKRTRVLVGVVVAAVVLALVAWAAWPRAAEAAYVTAPASRGGITQTISLVGPVERDGQAEVTYRSNGMVTAVHVRVGDQVAAGQQVVSIDSAPLRLAVLQAQAQVAQAEAQLDADLAAQRSGAPAIGTPSTGNPPAAATPGLLPGTPSPGGPSPGSPPADAAPPAYLTRMNTSLVSLQQAVQFQQQQCTPVFQALQQLRELQENLPTAIPTALPTALPTAVPTALPTRQPTAEPTATPTPQASPEPTASASPEPTASASPEPTTGPTASASPSATPTALPSIPPLDELTPELRQRLAELLGMAGQLEACSEAMVGLARAEGEAGTAIGEAVQGFAAQTQQAQVALSQARAELEQAMQAAQAQVEAAARKAAEDAIRQAQAQLEAQMAATYGGVVTDATIASDRARLVQARQQLDSAQADLAAATQSTPIAGVVGAIDYAVGESSAGRSAVIVGDGGARVSVDVPLAVRGLVAPGVPARVGQLAAPATLNGQVTGVSVLPSTATGQSYRTEVVADDPDQTLRSGSWADVTLTLAQASDVLTVPASAVTKITDTTATVEVVDAPLDQTARTVTVVTGRTGGGRVEIVSGLAEGQIIVLSDTRLPVPGGIDQYQPMARSGGGATPTPAR
ncbi:biotin/lipoyl-binding protein [Propioniciclava sinopodophylli]|uniref:Biotin/lipoyl-binding protein n=1 Tax=Propioniciclava sinopodophylli TaxID=1837344 RepID=A0A4Q9KG17_9ACTN|nr:biotin/lipoyl-binding protein [Propioniciclava sinopodophylli]TBT87369.1 biotin/lipoyl-binding protein [Propioniciclava sinopodophylli]